MGPGSDADLHVPPVSTVTEWLEGPLAGSKFVYVYSPQGNKAQIDVYGEFTSKTLPRLLR